MTTVVGYLLLFTAVGIGFMVVNLLLGKLMGRPTAPNPEKDAIYECGEPTIGSSWVQFDLRFYVVALLFIIFDVEVAFFFPWAVVFGKSNQLTVAAQKQQGEQIAAWRDGGSEVARAVAGDGAIDTAEVARRSRTLAWIAFGDILVFFGVLLVGFAYVWKRGDLDWVRALAQERALVGGAAANVPRSMPEPVEVG